MMRHGAEPAAIIFDLWFTLVTPDEHRDDGVHTIPQIPRVLGLDPAPFHTYWRTCVARHYRQPRRLRDDAADYLASLGRNMTDAEAAAFDAIWTAHDRALAAPRQAVVTALAQLATDGHRLGLLSNAHEREIRTWSSSPLAAHFDAACFSCHIGAVKPEPTAYVHVLQQLGVRAEQAVFVGDGASGELAGARRAGFGKVVLMRGLLEETDVNAETVRGRVAEADVVIDRIDEISERVTGD